METGRLRNMKRDEWLSFICKTNVIQGESHFTCVCYEYSQLREIMFSKVDNLEFNLMSNEETRVQLTNHDWKELDNFLEKAWEKGNDILYEQQYAILSCMVTSNKSESGR